MRVLYFDYPSLPAAVAVLCAQRAVARRPAATLRLAFGGYDVLGLDVAVPVTLDQLEEIDAWGERARAVGLTVGRPSRRPATTLAHVVGDHADDVGLGEIWRTAAIEAYWRDDADLGDPDMLIDLARHVGLDAATVAAAVADTSRVRRVRRRMAAAHQRGIGGVPVLEIDGAIVDPHLDDAQWDELLSHA